MIGADGREVDVDLVTDPYTAIKSRRSTPRESGASSTKPPVTGTTMKTSP
jgi:hypothetical protein